MTGTRTTNPAGSPVLRRPESESADPPDSEFDRFRKLAAKLAKVPKTELDEKLKKG